MKLQRQLAIILRAKRPTAKQFTVPVRCTVLATNTYTCLLQVSMKKSSAASLFEVSLTNSNFD